MSKLTEKLIKDFKSGPINKTDLIIILSHFTIGLSIWFIFTQGLVDKNSLKSFTSGYLFLSPLILVGLFFRRLRRIKFYLAWLIISIIQIFIYQKVKDNPDFIFPRGTAFDGLTSMLPTLILFQICRQIFYLIKGQEMIISLRHYRFTMYEEEDKRNMTWIEVAFSILIGLTAVLSGIFLTET
jgi:Na+/proline symporter